MSTDEVLRVLAARAPGPKKRSAGKGLVQMGAQPAEHGQGRLGVPPMETVQELRAALRLGHGFSGDAGRLDAELAALLLRGVPVDRLDQVPAVVDLAQVAEVVAAYRGRVWLAADREANQAVDEAVADLLARSGTE